MAFRNLTSLAEVTTGSSCVIPVPTNQINDIVVTLVYLEATGAITQPAGHTLKTDLATTAATRGRLAMYWHRVVGAIESGSYTYTLPASTDHAGLAVSFSGRVQTGDPFDVAPNGLEGASASTSQTNTGVTTVTAGCDLIGFASNFAGGSPWTPPSGMTERYDTSSSVTCDTQDNIAVGATGSKVFSEPTASGIMKSIIAALTPELAKPGIRGRSQAVNRAATF